MLCVLPISKSDAHLTDALVKAFETFTPGTNHRLLVVSDPQAKDAASVLLNKIRGFFADAHQETFLGIAKYDWPVACNYYFQQAAYLVNRYVRPNEGWLWMEMDSTPIAPNWLSIIEQEYYADNVIAYQERRGMRRYMGATERTVTSKLGEMHEDGEHMASVGVYPGDFAVQCPVLKSVGSEQLKVHFSVHLKWYPVKSLNKTSLIQNNRETTNYREENGQIICDSIARNAWEIHYNEPLSPKAVLVHGCKDGSLINAVPADRKVDIEVRVAQPPPLAIPQVNAKQKILTGRPNPLARPQAPRLQQNVPLKSSPVVHMPLEKPTVRKFGDLATSGGNKAQTVFSDTGEIPPAPTTATSIPMPVVLEVGPRPAEAAAANPTPEPLVEQEVAVTKSAKSTKKNARKSAWTPERRAKQAEIFKARMAAKKSAIPEPETAPV